MTPRSFCVAGAICSMPSRSSRDLDPGVACDSTSFFVWQASEKFCWYCQRLVVTLRPFCVACAIISRPSDPTHRLGRVTSDLFVALAIQNTFRDPTYILIAYDPTDQFVTLGMGFVWQVQQFRCLWDERNVVVESTGCRGGEKFW